MQTKTLLLIFHSPRRSLFFCNVLFSQKNLYEVLGIVKTSTPQQIKHAYFYKAKSLHPDIVDADQTISMSEKMLRKQQFLDLKFAYDILRKPNDRHHYDAVGKVYPSNKSASGAKRTRQNYYSNYSESYSEWGKFYTGQGKDNGQASYQDIQKKNSEQWKRVLIFSGIGFGLVFLYNFGYFLMLVARENKIRKLSAREEIARSFLRQPDYKVSSNDKEELDRFGKIFLDDIEEAYNRNILDHRIHNTKEIREEGRWFDYLKADNWIPRTAYDKREVENIKKDN